MTTDIYEQIRNGTCFRWTPQELLQIAEKERQDRFQFATTAWMMDADKARLFASAYLIEHPSEHVNPLGLPLHDYISKLGLTRNALKKLLGEPDYVSNVTKKRPHPYIYKYGNIEYHFQSWKLGKCVLIMNADTHKILAKA